MIRTINLTMSLLFYAIIVSAQSEKISGAVIDAITQEMIPFVTIAVYHNSELIDGTTSD